MTFFHYLLYFSKIISLNKMSKESNKDAAIVLSIGALLGVAYLGYEVYRINNVPSTGKKEPAKDTAKTVIQEKNENAADEKKEESKPAGNEHVTDAPAAAIPDDRKVNTETLPGMNESAKVEQQLMAADNIDQNREL